MSRYSRREEIQSDNTGNISSSVASTIGHGLSTSPAAYWVTPAITPAMTNVAMVVTSDNSVHYDVAMRIINVSSHDNFASRSMDFINVSKIIKMVRILGLMVVISYMIVILFTWIYANLEGYVYFSAGEPELFIKYPEWALGAIGIFAAVDCLHKELKDETGSG